MIPSWLQEKLASPPDAGTGIHAWLFSVARQLHVHMPPEAVHAALQAATTNAGRRVPAREIRDAVQNSRACAWQPRKLKAKENAEIDSASLVRETWPPRDENRRQMGIRLARKEGVAELYDLWERSPVRVETTSADDWLDWLFPDAEWICLAKDHPATARTRRREKWSFGPAEECGLVVPSPMTGPSGKALDGKQSHRCLNNTGPRRWLVIEFDETPIDEQAASHFMLGKACDDIDWPPLRLCVHSGGKSLHGWYGPVRNESDARTLLEWAVIHGADTASWNRCQLVRLPGGTRNGQKLEVFYFNPRK